MSTEIKAFPSAEEIKKYSGEYRYCPIKAEILSDIRTPIEVLRILKGASSHVYMLESVEDQRQWGRYTFLGYAPTLCVTCTDGDLRVTDDEGNVIHTEQISHPAGYIRELLSARKSARPDEFPTFPGGLVGYFAYDYIKYSEPRLKLDAADEEHFRDVDLMLFDKVICFDNLRQKIIVTAQVDLSNVEESYAAAVRAIGEILDLEPGTVKSRIFRARKRLCAFLLE